MGVSASQVKDSLPFGRPAPSSEGRIQANNKHPPLKSILLISKDYPPEICGVGDYSMHVKAALESLGWQVAVLTWRRQENNASGCWWLLQQSKPPTALKKQLLASLKAVMHVLQQPILFWQYTPGSFSKKNAMPWQVPMVTWLLKFQGIKQVVFFHEVSVRLWGNGIRQFVQAVVQRIIAKKMKLAANRSATSISLYQTYFPWRKPILIPVGSNFLYAAPGGVQLPEKDYCFCFSNRFNEPLAEAFARLKKEVVAFPFKLVLAGSIEKKERADLENLLNKYGLMPQTMLMGELPAEELADVLSFATLVCQPQPLDEKGRGGISAKNGTAVAAFQYGRPIISVRGDMTEPRYFIHGENCWLLEENSPNAWHQAMRTLQENEGKRTALAMRARSTYETHFTWRKIASSLDRLFREVLQP